jgi:hypothetical protein
MIDEGVPAEEITAVKNGADLERHVPAAKAPALARQLGLELSRADFYKEELPFQVSCSYGPGRYHPAYEEGGHDYPVGFVRSTEQPSSEVVLDMMADGRPDVTPLITHRFSIEDAEKACEVVGDSEPSLIIRDSRLRSDTYASISSRTLCHRAASISPSFPPSLALSMQRI